MTATASPQVSGTTIHCANGEQITVVEHADGTTSVTFTRRPLFNTVFTADRIACDETPAQAAAQYANTLANENGGPVTPEGGSRTWHLARLTIAATYVGGIYDAWQVTVCDLHTLVTVGDLRWSVQGAARAATVAAALAAKLRTASPAQAMDAAPRLNSLLTQAA